ncbi:MAG: ParB N-terminal domain-containing protein [Alphaproteobacteria bacterium]
MNTELVEIEITDIIVAYRPRRDDGDLTALQDSIRQVGLLHPILVDRGNVLVAGGRRLAACRAIGREKIPALRLDVAADTMTALDIQAAENLCRQPLTAAELDQHIRKKKDVLARKGGRSRTLSWIRKAFARS